MHGSGDPADQIPGSVHIERSGQLANGTTPTSTPTASITSETITARHSTLRWWSPRFTFASELAERMGVSRATVQRHLAALAAQGRVEVRLRYGTTGRPEHRYARAR